MKLLNIVQRSSVPQPWAEGEKIPWGEPDFSQRMLQEHLSQNHDGASRRFATIDQHVRWIDEQVLKSTPTAILDLGCGPGLYTSRLARLGHRCHGIDYSPAAVAYATEQAAANTLECTYSQKDIRTADYGTGYGLAMLTFGEFNVFRPSEARTILEKIHQALLPGGFLLLEPHRFNAVRQMGRQPTSWYAVESGLFSDEPHLCLQENFWNSEDGVAIERYYIIDAITSKVTRHSSSTQAYTDEQYRTLLAECHFDNVKFYPAWGDSTEGADGDFMLILSQRSHPS